MEVADSADPKLLQMATTEGGVLGRGGMHTKVLAAQQAGLGGTHTVIADGNQSNIIDHVFNRTLPFTLLYSQISLSDLDQVFVRTQKKYIAEQ